MARNFSGSRSGSGSNVSLKIIRDTLRKGGRINEDTFKKIVKAKLAEARSNAANNPAVKSSMFGNKGGAKRSDKAQKAVNMMNQIKIAKEIRRAAKEVVIVVRRFINGKIDEKGRIKDLAGNLVARVNIKNGAMSTLDGQYIGVYDGKSQGVVNKIQDAINKFSPYFIAQRTAELKLKQQREGGAEGDSNKLDVWSRTPTDVWGRAQTDVWGRAKSDVWGRTQSDMWGNAQLDMWGNQL